MTTDLADYIPLPSSSSEGSDSPEGCYAEVSQGFFSLPSSELSDPMKDVYAGGNKNSISLSLSDHSFTPGAGDDGKSLRESVTFEGNMSHKAQPFSCIPMNLLFHLLSL